MLLIISISWIFLFDGVTYSQTIDKQIASRINLLLKDKYFESTLISVDIYDLTRKKILYQKNNKLLLHPASNMKVLTSAAALKYLGGDYQFKTSLHYEGEIVDSVLYGHLFVVGGCDPDFTSSDLELLTQSLKDNGITKITGNIYGDVSITDSLFWGSGWMWDDDPSTDAPYMSALNINDNVITILGAYDYQQNKFVVKSVPETDYIEITQNITWEDSKNSHFDVNRDWINRTNKFFVTGNFSKNDLTNKSYFVKKFNVFKPEYYFLTLFKESLDRNGIRFTGDLKIKSHDEFVKPIYTFSRSYDTVIVNLNKTSDNLSTEMTLRALAEKYFEKPVSVMNGIKMIDSLIILCGLNPKDYRLVDGSGVSHYNLVSAELLLSVLKHFYYNEKDLFESLYESFPNAGIDGSLAGRMKRTLAENNVHAKTGTLSGVSSLSGYVKNKKGNMIAFSILVQNYVGSSKQARDFIDKVCEIIAESR
jgi:D-alanyl-D-alanine carboxypeptidase/D-alanyl-D-alanine-endopeptidase (penicillin-binding protein 4)